jgi:hypothetical protein
MGRREMLSDAKALGRTPTAGDAIAVVSARFLPQSEPPGSIPLEAVASILSDLEVGDGSLKDEARKAINAGFVARCAEFSKGLQTQLNSLKKSGQEEAPAEGTGQTCRDLKPKRPGENAGTETTLDELLGFTEDSEEEQLPRVTASGSFSENVSGAASPSPAMGTTFQFTADFEAGTITGSLKGGRTSTPGGWMNCYELSNPSLEFERIDVETTDSYTASFSGAIDKENGEFSLALSPKGAGSSRKMQLFVDERCLDLNTKKYSGDGGWTGQGTISGGVSKDGGYELRTSWTYTRFSGEVQVGGTTSGNGIVSTPD